MPVGAAAYLSAGMFAGAAAVIEYGLRPGERAVTVEVAGGLADAGPAPGSRVDVLVSTERPRRRRTQMALAGAELLGVGEAAAGYSDPDSSATSAGPTALATLRVTVRQAIYLTRGRQLRPRDPPPPRPPGDRSRAGAVVAQAQL